MIISCKIYRLALHCYGLLEIDGRNDRSDGGRLTGIDRHELDGPSDCIEGVAWRVEITYN